MSSEDVVRRALSYERMAREYLANGEIALGKGEHRKASEMFWGCASQAIKALAAVSGRRLESHGAIKRFVQQVATETGDSELKDVFDLVEKLHRNFYDEEISEEELRNFYLDRLRRLLQKTRAIAQESAKKEGLDLTSILDEVEISEREWSSDSDP